MKPCLISKLHAVSNKCLVAASKEDLSLRSFGISSMVFNHLNSQLNVSSALSNFSSLPGSSTTK
tara:strand:- start:12185 stop:12376 length:192 start_codon:yes stop_codon:yes gene_type:complete